jgi:Transposase IS66 family
VVFDFRLGRGLEGLKRFLGQFEGILQSDGYAAYEQGGGPKIAHACCWAHLYQYYREHITTCDREIQALLDSIPPRAEASNLPPAGPSTRKKKRTAGTSI